MSSSGRMTTLQAVNIMLQGIGAPRASALDTGGTSITAEAEAMLDEITDEVQSIGWAIGTTHNYEYKIPTVTIEISGGSGTPLFDETITESTSGATGQYKFSGSKMHIVPLTGTFSGGETLTGETSGATRDGGTLETVTESVLFVNTSWSKVVPGTKEHKRVVRRGDQLYDEIEQTGLFSDSIFLDVTRDLFFTDLTFNLANYIARLSAVRFNRWKTGNRKDDQYLVDQMEHARAQAYREDEEIARTNTLNTPDSLDVKGWRRQYYGVRGYI